MKTEPRKMFICVCGKAFNKPSLLLRHNSKHSKSRLFICSLCNKSFTQNVTLQNHLKNNVCARRAIKQLEPSSSNILHEPTKREMKNIVCIYCDKSFLKRSELERHIKTHTNERLFQCEESGCGKSFKLKSTLEKHSTTHRNPTFTCDVCLCNYKSEKCLMKHMQRHSRCLTIEVNQQAITTIEVNEPARSNIKHANGEITHKSTLLCDLLDESFLPPNDSPSTLEINYFEIGNAEIVESTDEIDERLESHASLPKTLRSNEFVCGVCSKRFKKPIDLRRHSDAVHEKKRPFVCPVEQCDKSFSLKCTLNRHVETHKGGRKLMTCEVCGKTLSCASSLKFHQRIHEDLKPEQCSICSSRFRTPGNLKSHLKTHMSFESNFMTDANGPIP